MTPATLHLVGSTPAKDDTDYIFIEKSSLPKATRKVRR